MTTAVFSTALAAAPEKPARLSLVAARVVEVLVESRARRAARELRRHEAFIQDLSRRQDHSAQFLDQADLLPAKI